MTNRTAVFFTPVGTLQAAAFIELPLSLLVRAGNSSRSATIGIRSKTIPRACASKCIIVRWSGVRRSSRQMPSTDFTSVGLRLPSGEGLVPRHDPCM